MLQLRGQLSLIHVQFDFLHSPCAAQAGQSSYLSYTVTEKKNQLLLWRFIGGEAAIGFLWFLLSGLFALGCVYKKPTQAYVVSNRTYVQSVTREKHLTIGIKTFFFLWFAQTVHPMDKRRCRSCRNPTNKMLQSLWRRANARNVSFFTLYGGQFTFSTQLLTLNFLIKCFFRDWCGQYHKI